MRLGESTIMLNCVLDLGVLPIKTVVFTFSCKKFLFSELLHFYINLDHITEIIVIKNYASLCDHV